MKTDVVRLPQEIGLEMVLIPGGSFTMGSPKDELGRSEDEGPQHQVTIDPFLMGKYPVTQAQWLAVSRIPKVERELDPDPSRFMGRHHPVEQVTWHEAMEFCARLSAYTKKLYTLPSESQWEYACRAGTNTPFYFGETLATSQANCNGRVALRSGIKGTYRKVTTDVGSFPPNDFGLYDLHGNVLEWCRDRWHDNYEGAPADGSAWTVGGDEHFRLLRGGAWSLNPEYCRSALRFNQDPAARDSCFGFRIVSVL